jgi:hypothetical protein
MKKKLKGIWLFTLVASLGVLSVSCSDPVGNVASANANEVTKTLVVPSITFGQCTLTKPKGEYTVTILTVDFINNDPNQPVIGNTYKGFSPRTGFITTPIGDSFDVFRLNDLKVPSKGAWAIQVDVRTNCDECANRFNNGCNFPQNGKVNFSRIYTFAPDQQPTSSEIQAELIFVSTICGC